MMLVKYLLSLEFENADLSFASWWTIALQDQQCWASS